MLKSLQDKRLSGVSVRKAYHDRFGQATHLYKMQKNVHLSILKVLKGSMQRLIFLYVFRCTKALLGCTKAAFVESRR